MRKVTVALGHSPGGKRCVMANIDGERYILLTVKRGPVVVEVLQLLSERFGVTGICGWPFNWHLARFRNTFELITDVGAVGVYVPADQYDACVDDGNTAWR